MPKPSTNLFWDTRPTCNWKVGGSAYFLKRRGITLGYREPIGPNCPSDRFYGGYHNNCTGQHIHLATSGATRTYSNQMDCVPKEANEVVMWKPLSNEDGTPNRDKCKNGNPNHRDVQGFNPRYGTIQCGSCYRYPARSGHTFNCKP